MILSFFMLSILIRVRLFFMGYESKSYGNVIKESRKQFLSFRCVYLQSCHLSSCVAGVSDTSATHLRQIVSQLCRSCVAVASSTFARTTHYSLINSSEVLRTRSLHVSRQKLYTGNVIKTIEVNQIT